MHGPPRFGSSSRRQNKEGLENGYTMCLETERVLISRKNFLTALHGFVSTDVGGRINLPQAQRLASLGTRYAKMCRVI
jgi:hypothetical protein